MTIMGKAAPGATSTSGTTAQLGSALNSALPSLRLFGSDGRLRDAPAGDGRIVLVVPDTMHTDLSTIATRVFLTRVGYDARGWGVGLNSGAVPEMLDRLLPRLEKLAATSQRDVNLVGCNRGMAIARAAERQLPHAVHRLASCGPAVRDAEDLHHTWLKVAKALAGQPA